MQDSKKTSFIVGFRNLRMRNWRNIRLPVKYVPFLFGISVFILLLILYNCIVDPYGIFKKDFSKQWVEPNQYYIKTKMLIDYPDRFTSLLFGSSRVSNIDIQSFFGQDAYNMAYSMGIPNNHLNILKNVVHSQKRLKHVIIGLDEFDFAIDPVEQKNYLLRKPHPIISGEPPIKFYLSYIFRRPSVIDSQIFLYLIEGITGSPFNIHFDILNTGRCLLPLYDRFLEKNLMRHITRESFGQGLIFHGPYSIQRLMKDIGEIIDLSKRHNFEASFFINPIHFSIIKRIDLPSFYIFKYELAKLTPFYDFSVISDIVKDNSNFYDITHYRTHMGYQIAKTLFEDNRTRSIDHSSFQGKYVDQCNISEHLKQEIDSSTNSPELNERFCDVFKLKEMETPLPQQDHLLGNNEIRDSCFCSIDTIDGAIIQNNLFTVEKRSDLSLLISGWFVSKEGSNENNEDLYLGLHSTSGNRRQFFYKLLKNQKRPGVASLFRLSPEMKLGFYGLIRLTEVPKGRYSIFLLHKEKQTGSRCNSPVTIQIN